MPTLQGSPDSSNSAFDQQPAVLLVSPAPDAIAQVTAGLAVYDTMQYIKPPISTLCVGQACSMGSILLAAGAPGMRRSLPNARVMIHQPSGGASGMAADIVRSFTNRTNVLLSRACLSHVPARSFGAGTVVVARNCLLLPPPIPSTTARASLRTSCFAGDRGARDSCHA